MSEPFDRAIRALPGARVYDVWLNDEGELCVDLEHRGCDDHACTLVVDQNGIEFHYPAPGTGAS